MTYHIGFAMPCLPHRSAEQARASSRKNIWRSPDYMRVRILLLVVPMMLAGCFLVPHKVEMQQGNYVDEKMLSRLKLDMTQDQVLFAMGTPLVVDPFHPDRWDYVYLTGKAGDVQRERGIALIFSEGRLIRIEGDVVPAGRPAQVQANVAPR